jgi:gliding motility-associated-like protein
MRAIYKCLLAFFIFAPILGNAQLTANFVISSPIPGNVGCVPHVVQFQSTSTGNPTIFNWNLGNNTTVATNNSHPSTTYLAAGTYTVTLTVSNGVSTSAPKTMTIVVHDTPTVDFSAYPPLAGCPPLTVKFYTTTPNSTSYGWTFGDGGTSSGPTPSHVYNASGLMTVKLEAVNAWGCKNSRTKTNYINVYDKPSANFSFNPTELCAPGTVNFSAATSGLNYSWNFGDGSSPGSGSNPSHTYSGPAPKTYTIKLDVTDANGCTNSTTKKLELYNNVANFSAPTDVCVGDKVNFTNTSSVPSNAIYWNFGDGDTAMTISPSHIYYVADTYTITLTSKQGNGCVNAKQRKIIVHPQPLIGFTWNPPLPCPVPATVQFLPTSGLANYLWDFGDPLSSSNTSTLTSPYHTYYHNKKYTVTLIGTSSAGCKDTITKDITIYDLFDTAFATPWEGCIPLLVHFNTLIKARDSLKPYAAWLPYPAPIATYAWDFGDGSPTSTLSTPVHPYTTVGVFRIICTITTTNGCTAKDTIYVRTGTPPNPSFTSPVHVCHREPVHFTNTTTLPNNQWLWVWGDSTIDTTANPTHQFKPGTYTVKFVAYYNGCPGDTFFKTVVVDSPMAVFNYDYFCHSDSLKYVKFTNLSLGANSWTWYFGDGQTSTQLNPLHYYASIGLYNVMLVVYNNASACYDTTFASVKTIAPVASFIGYPTTICKEDTVFFSAALSGSIANGYWWYVNNIYVAGPPLWGVNYQHIFYNTGYYKVKVLIADEHNCLDSAIRNNYVFVEQPKPGFTAAPQIGCVPLNVLFTDTSIAVPGIPIKNRYWSFGNNNGSANTANKIISHLYTKAGVYDIQLIVTDSLGCVDSVTRPGYIQALKPVALFSAPDTACANAVVKFNNTSQNATIYSWDFGDGGTSTVSQPTHIYAQAGKYTVSLIATDAYGCADTFVKYPDIRVFQPHAAFTMSDSFAVCPPLWVNFKNASTGTSSYKWTLGTGANSNNVNPTEYYTKSGNFLVTLIAKDTHGCADTATNYVKILGFAGGFSYSPLSGCVPLMVNFIDSFKNLSNAIWDFNDGYTDTVGSGYYTHIYTIPGLFVPKIIFTDGKGCIAYNTGLDTIRVDAAMAGFKWGPACENEDVILYDTSKGYFSPIVFRWWLFNNGQTNGATTVTHHFGPAGKYPVQLSVINGNGCKDTLIADVTVNSLPHIDAGADTIVCLHDSATLYPSGGVSYTWAPPSYLSCTSCTNPHAAPPGRFVYTVTGTDANGCTNKDTVQVNTKTKVHSITGPNGEICDLQEMQLHIEGAHHYVWTPQDGLNDNKIADPVASPHNTTNYIVVAYEGSCIPDTHAVKVEVHPLPTVHASGTQTIIAGNSADIQAIGSLIQRFVWTPAESLSCSDCPAPTARPSKTTIYTVKVYTDYGCTDSDNVTITVLCDKSQLFMPNTFTPNGDGQNDIFYPRGVGLGLVQSFRIYNRWGELMFERKGFNLNDKNYGWNGTFKNENLKPDVYVYTIQVYCDGGELMIEKGDVTIIR